MLRTRKESSTETSSLPTFLSPNAATPRFWTLDWPNYHLRTVPQAEFQKFLDHRSIVRNCPLGALAHLGLARAYVQQGDTVKTKAAYQDFLTLWKDADPDIPILIAAKSEYARLK